MKKRLVYRFIWIMFIIHFSSAIFAQNPTYLCELRNDAQVSPKVFEFDIFVVRTGTTPFEYAGGQFGIIVNPLIKNAGVITPTIVPGSTDPIMVAANQNPTSITFSDPQNVIRIAGRIPPGAGNGPVIPDVSPGVRICRVRLTNSVDFGQFQPNMIWTTTTIYPTQIAAYVAILAPPFTVLNTPVMVASSQTTDNLSNFILNDVPPPSAFVVTGGGSYCQGEVGLLVELSNSEVGVTYTLFKDAIAQVPTISGTGSVLSLGNQIAGTYTISGNNTTGTTIMTGNAVISENPLPALPTVLAIQPTCALATGTITVTAPTEAGMTYSIDGSTYINTTGVFNSVVSGTYSVTAKSSAGCVSTGTIVTLNSGFVIPVMTTSTTATTCSGIAPSISLTASVPSTFIWTIGAVTGGVTGAVSGAGALISQVLTYPGITSGTVEYIVTPVSVSGTCTGAPLSIIVTVNPVSPVSVSVIAGSIQVCEGSSVFFNATPVNGGTTPSYQWKVNNLNVGGNSSTYSYIPVNSDVITCVLTSNATCVSGTTATSNAISMLVDPATVGGSVTGTSLPVSYGVSTGTITLSGHTGNVVKWQKMFGTGAWTDIANTTITFSEVPLSMGIWLYRAVVMSGSCSQKFSAESTINVIPKAIVVTPVSGQTMIYGQADPVFTYTNTPAIESGDSFTGTLGRVSGADVGTYAYTLGTLSAGTNYTLTMGGTSTFGITSKTVVITPNAGQTKVYGQLDPVFTSTNSPALEAGDSFTGALARVSGTNTGSYGFVLGTLSAGNNYNLTLGGTSTFSISPKPIFIIANTGQSKIYGQTDPSALSYTIAPALEGTDLVTGNISRNTGESVGNYLFTLGNLDAGSNYSLSMAGTNMFIISAKSLTATGVAANNKVYDGTTTSALNAGSANLNGLIAGDAVTLNTTGASGNFADKNVGTGKPVTIIGMTISGADAFNYTLMQPVSAADITAAGLTVSGVTAANKVYDGTTAATLNSTSAVMSGVIGSDAVILNSASASGLFANKNVGTVKTVTVTGFTLSGADAGNYIIVQPASAADITPKALTLTGTNLSKVYGTALTLTGNEYTSTVLVSGDVLSGVSVLSSGSSATANAGSYATAITGGTNANYIISYVDGSLTVTKADQTITFEDLPAGMRMTQELTLGAVSASGLPVVYSVSDPSVASVSGNILTVNKEGSANIIASQAGNNNWNAATDVSKALTTLPTFDNVNSLFSPNGDGMNDYWYIRDLDKYGTVQVVVYNRFGKAVYESGSYKNDWDGTMNGNPLPSATYYYMIKSSQRGTIYGPVNIVR